MESPPGLLLPATDGRRGQRQRRWQREGSGNRHFRNPHPRGDMESLLGFYNGVDEGFRTPDLWSHNPVL